MYTIHEICRACGYGPKIGAPGIKSDRGDEKLLPVLDLGVMPLANDFVRDGEAHRGFAPLQVLFCPSCCLAQLSVVVDPKILYSQYAYMTSPSATMKAHFESFVSMMREAQEPGPVIEIGSNDGLFLQHLQANGFSSVIGIDPAANLVKVARERDVRTIEGFVTPATAAAAVDAVGKPSFIIARHVFCHVNDWRSLIATIEGIASEKTIVLIEVPYAKDQLELESWDQVYHEHLSYLSLRSIQMLLRTSSLYLHAVNRFPIHGGSIVIELRHNNHPCAGCGVDDMVRDEDVTYDQWISLGAKSRGNVAQLKQLVAGARAAGEKVVGYGASAKSTIWLNACGFTRKDISFVCDCTATKQYTTCPGTDIPVVDEGALTRELPKYAVLFAWNYAEEIIAKEQYFRKHGGKWIVLIPKMKIVSAGAA